MRGQQRRDRHYAAWADAGPVPITRRGQPGRANRGMGSPIPCPLRRVIGPGEVTGAAAAGRTARPGSSASPPRPGRASPLLTRSGGRGAPPETGETVARARRHGYRSGRAAAEGVPPTPTPTLRGRRRLALLPTLRGRWNWAGFPPITRRNWARNRGARPWRCAPCERGLRLRRHVVTRRAERRRAEHAEQSATSTSTNEQLVVLEQSTPSRARRARARTSTSTNEHEHERARARARRA